MTHFKRHGKIIDHTLSIRLNRSSGGNCFLSNIRSIKKIEVKWYQTQHHWLLKSPGCCLVKQPYQRLCHTGYVQPPRPDIVIFRSYIVYWSKMTWFPVGWCFCKLTLNKEYSFYTGRDKPNRLNVIQSSKWQ